LRQGRGHELLYFHQVDDPYSHLMAQALVLLLRRFEVQVRPVVVGPPPDSAAPERERLVAYSRVDAQRIARWHGLQFDDPQAQPHSVAVARAALSLLDAIDSEQFLARVLPVGAQLWQGATPQDALSRRDVDRLDAALAKGAGQRARLGHYLGATVYYGGEWYWGIDRLYHLEKRLAGLGACRPGQEAQALLFAPEPDLDRDLPAAGAREMDFFFSLRSPYSAIVAPRVFALARRTGARVNLRYLLPMVMRGLPVPAEKRRYIALDAAREAHERGIAFGRLNDPLGRPTERGLALMHWAEGLGPVPAQAYLLAFMHGVWAQGIDAGSDAGLRRIVEAAQLPWQEARQALNNEAWRAQAQVHREQLLALGLWGVPSFRVGDLAVWGQDRLSLVQAAVLGPSWESS
jgi:2-hydroxychromene-2-carboxylate isomerase